MRVVFIGLAAGALLGALVVIYGELFFSPEQHEWFYRGIGIGLGVGAGGVLGILGFNWLIGTLDRIKSGKL